jgi:hypothetical protein
MPICSAKLRSSQSQVSVPVVPMGEVSVMPQACHADAFAHEAFDHRGRHGRTPQTTCFRLGGMPMPDLSISWRKASHTVGTPADAVTFSRRNRSHSTAASFTAE